MKLLYAKVDKATYLVKNTTTDDLWIWWACCHYGPEKDLSKIVNGDLLDECQSMLSDSSTEWVEMEAIDVDDGLGLRCFELEKMDHSTTFKKES